MKRLMDIYESCKTPIRVAYFAFVLIAFGFLIQNPNVNIFYTFRSNIILFIAELALRIGEFTLMNLPIIFMLNFVCKKANNASPVVMSLIGYFTFLVTTMLLSPQNLSSQAYMNSSIFNIASGSRSPLETGMIGSFLVAYATRAAFIFSRHRSNYSLTNLFSRDMAGIVYNFIFCFLLGVLVSYSYPILYGYIQKSIAFIGADLSDPMRIGLYSILDRVLSILGLGNIIRYPFWFTAAGGSLSNTMTGQSILGDVNIFSYVKETNAAYVGAGRFITPYYVINMFMIPGIYLGTLCSVSDKKDRSYLWIMFVVAILLSIAAGNPLPIELLMLLTSPFLLAVYLLLIGLVSGFMVSHGVYLGFSGNVSNILTAMPGSFADYIINIRNASLTYSLRYIALIGAVAFLLCFAITWLYYRFFAFDFVKTGKGDEFVRLLIDSVGGIDNIIDAGAGLFKLNIYLKEPERISIEKIQDTGVHRVSETRDGLSFEIGTPSYAIAHRIKKQLKK
ncbi:MAG: hypothetical protein IKS51_03340 [Erysipelotrichaceae bacterium]|nr:hypothetical protein [Erysipelotrichaceae bacterium]